jgi:hypothetical protein
MRAARLVPQEDEAGGVDHVVECPVCGSESNYLAPVDVRVISGSGAVVTQSAGTRDEPGGLDRRGGLVGARGVQIEVTFIAEECDHEITLAMQFHKGMTYLGIGPRALPCGSKQVIWRD